MSSTAVVKHWDETLPELEKTFYGFPPLRPYLYRCVTGSDPSSPLPRDWIERWTVDTFLSDLIPVGRCLSLCSGFGEVERILAGLGVFEHCIGVDIAGGALAEARRRAAEAALDSIEYRELDVNAIELEPESYDLVWANGALHHLTALEHVVDQVYTALKPGGIFVADEYVGPAHQQIGERQRELVNSLIHLIPRRLRNAAEDTFVPSSFQGPRTRTRLFQAAFGRIEPAVVADRLAGRTGGRAAARGYAAYRQLLHRGRRGFRYGKVWDVNPWYFERVDPSEGARSDEILAIVRDRFDDVDVRHYNGSLLLWALDLDFYERYDDSRDRAILDVLTETERRLIDAGEIESNHAHLIARKGR